MTILFFVYLAAMILGVAIARTPLNRKSFWARWAMLTAALILAILIPSLLEYYAPDHPAMIGPMIISILVVGVVLLPAAFFLAFLWQARRMIDATGSPWWALLGIIPVAFIVFGALPSRPTSNLTKSKAADVFR